MSRPGSESPQSLGQYPGVTNQQSIDFLPRAGQIRRPETRPVAGQHGIEQHIQHDRAIAPPGRVELSNKGAQRRVIVATAVDEAVQPHPACHRSAETLEGVRALDVIAEERAQPRAFGRAGQNDMGEVIHAPARG